MKFCEDAIKAGDYELRTPKKGTNKAIN